MLKPPRLKKGDTIGIVSTSSPVAALCPNRFHRGIKALEEMGYRVKIGKHATKKKGHLAGTIEERLEDFHEMIIDKDVKVVLNTIGGHNSNQLLDALDYELIQQNPKIIIGYSDFTAVLHAIHQRSNLVTFLGPALLPQFGEYGGLLPYTKNYFTNLVEEPSDQLELKASDHWVFERLMWDKEDVRPRKQTRNEGPTVIREGQATGRILAGNLGTMLLAAGTPYLPSFKGRILFLEEDETEQAATFDRYLTQLRNMGAFEEISGLVIGRFHPDVPFHDDYPLSEILKVTTRGYDFPIIANVDFGHTDPMLTLPNGILAEISATSNDAAITLLENAVE